MEGEEEKKDLQNEWLKIFFEKRRKNFSPPSSIVVNVIIIFRDIFTPCYTIEVSTHL